jgi:hypothetical protein
MAASAPCDPATTWLTPISPSLTAEPRLAAFTSTVTGVEAGGGGGTTAFCSLMSRIDGPFTPV